MPCLTVLSVRRAADGRLGNGALNMPGLQLIPDMVTQYKLPCTNQQVEDLQAAVLIPTCLVAFALWWRVVRAAPSAAAQDKKKR